MDERTSSTFFASRQFRPGRYRQRSAICLAAFVMSLLMPVQVHAECDIQRFRAWWDSSVWGCSFEDVATRFWSHLTHELISTSDWWSQAGDARDARHHDFCAVSTPGSCIQSRVLEYRCPAPMIINAHSIEQGRLLGCMEGECPAGHDRDDYGVCLPEDEEPEPEGPVPVQPDADPRKQSLCQGTQQPLAAITATTLPAQARADLQHAFADQPVPSIRSCSAPVTIDSIQHQARELPCFETRDNIQPASLFM